MNIQRINELVQQATPVCRSNHRFYGAVATALGRICQAVNMHQSIEEDLAPLLAEFEVFELFDIPFQSDEECSVFLLRYKGEPFCLQLRVGDRCDYMDGCEILSAPVAANVMRGYLELRMKSVEQDLQEQTLRQDVFTTITEGTHTYLEFVAPLVATVRSPRWACSFPSVIHANACWLERDGGVVRIKRFVQWTHANMPSWTGGLAHVACLELEDGTQVEVDTREVLVWLGVKELAPKDPCEGLRAEKDCWTLTSECSQHNSSVLLNVTQRYRGKALADHVYHRLVQASDELKVFLQKHEGENDGLFEEAMLKGFAKFRGSRDLTQQAGI